MVAQILSLSYHRIAWISLMPKWSHFATLNSSIQPVYDICTAGEPEGMFDVRSPYLRPDSFNKPIAMPLGARKKQFIDSDKSKVQRSFARRGAFALRYLLHDDQRWLFETSKAVLGVFTCGQMSLQLSKNCSGISDRVVKIIFAKAPHDSKLIKNRSWTQKLAFHSIRLYIRFF